MNTPTLKQLVTFYLEERLTPEQESRLQQLLHNNAEARGEFVAAIEMHALLCREARPANGFLPETPPPIPPPTAHSAPDASVKRALLWLAIALGVLGLLAWAAAAFRSPANVRASANASGFVPDQGLPSDSIERKEGRGEFQPDEVTRVSTALASGYPPRAAQALDALRTDPAFIALLQFAPTQRMDGNYRLVQGRWPGSHAAEFRGGNDHVRFSAGGDRAFPQLSLAVWVRLDRLGGPNQSLLHTDGWSAEKVGQVHWLITPFMTVRLGCFGNHLAPGSDEKVDSPESRTPILSGLGRWVHLVTVYDSETRTVRFFLNGQLDKETHLSVAPPARLGPAQVGNWDGTDRRLSGRIDELLLLGRAMSDAEVLELFESGNPYR